MTPKKLSVDTSDRPDSPRKRLKTEKTSVSVVLDNNLLERLDALARKMDYSRTALIKLAILQLLKIGARIDGEPLPVNADGDGANDRAPRETAGDKPTRP